MNGDDQVRVPRGLALAAAIGWRALVVAAAILAVGVVLLELRIPFLAVFLAIFATALLRPLCARLRALGWPPAAAAGGVLAGAVAVVAGLAWVLLPPFISQMRDLGDQVTDGLDRLKEWLVEGPIGLSNDELDEYLEGARDAAADNAANIASGVLTGAQLVVEVVAIFAIALVLTFFFLKDEERITGWLVGLFAQERRDHVREIGARSWTSLAGYLRGMTIVATFDSVFIGLSLVFLGVPAAVPLAVFTFFGAYVPIAGALVTGMAAVLVALVAEGAVTALLTLAAVLAVQQIESNLLQPVVVGRAVQVHPVAILLAVTSGAVLAGIVGALVAVPIVAVASRVIGYLRERSPGDSVPA